MQVASINAKSKIFYYIKKNTLQIQAVLVIPDGSHKMKLEKSEKHTLTGHFLVTPC